MFELILLGINESSTIYISFKKNLVFGNKNNKIICDYKN